MLYVGVLAREAIHALPGHRAWRVLALAAWLLATLLLAFVMRRRGGRSAAFGTALLDVLWLQLPAALAWLAWLYAVDASRGIVVTLVACMAVFAAFRGGFYAVRFAAWSLVQLVLVLDRAALPGWYDAIDLTLRLALTGIAASLIGCITVWFWSEGRRRLGVPELVAPPAWTFGCIVPVFLAAALGVVREEQALARAASMDLAYDEWSGWLEIERPPGVDEIDAGFFATTPVFVVLRPERGIWRPESLHATEPVAAPGTIVLQGEVWRTSDGSSVQYRVIDEVRRRRVERSGETPAEIRASGRQPGARVRVTASGRIHFDAILADGNPVAH